MKRLFFAVITGLLTFKPLAADFSGTIYLNNRTPSGDVRIYAADGVHAMGTAPGGATAQLLLLTTNGTLVPLFPTTTFRTGTAAFFVLPVEVPVPGVPPGSTVTVVLHAWENGNNSPGTRWESLPLRVTLGGETADGETLPPAELIGLEGGRPITPQLVFIQSVSRQDDRLHFSFYFEYAIDQPSFTVETSLDMVQWQPVLPTWGTIGPNPVRHFSLPLESANNPPAFFRVRMDRP